MSLLDSILNLVILLLWLNWRSIRIEAGGNPLPRTLASTLKSTTPARFKGWPPLISLCLLLVLRIVLYREIGSPVDWTPKLNLGFVVLAFRSDTLPTAALYSVLSSLRLVLVFYFWLLVVLAVNQGTANPDVIEKLLRLHVGRMSRWPRTIQILLPMLVGMVLWMAVHPLLTRYHVALPAGSVAHLAAQGLVVAAGLVLSLKYLLPTILLAYVLLSYVYLGSNPIWDFIGSTARNLLQPLRSVPLRVAKVDLAPFGGVLLVVFFLHWMPNLLVSELAHRNLTLWPQ